MPRVIVKPTDFLQNMQSDVSLTLVTQWDIRGNRELSSGSDVHPRSCQQKWHEDHLSHQGHTYNSTL